MLTGIESSVWVRVIQRSGFVAFRNTRIRNFRVTSALTPWTIALFGLALAVALWGFGYKLSRYNPHLDAAARASYAKLWDKHQDTSELLTSKLTAHPQQCAQLEALSVFFQEPIAPVFAPIHTAEDDRSIVTSLVALIPFRSPPSRHFSA